MKLCDLFEVTLDELTGRAQENEKQTETVSQPSIQIVKNSAVTTEKIVGCILLAVSLLGGILLAIFADPAMALLIALPMLICAIVCLAVKRRAGYWCMWIVWFILEVFLIFLVARSAMAMSSIGTVSGGILLISLVIEAALYVSLFILTLRTFKGESLSAPKRKGILLVVAWIIYLALCVLPELLMHMTTRMNNMFGILVFYILPSAIPMIATPILFIYTARYLSSRKHTSK